MSKEKVNTKKISKKSTQNSSKKYNDDISLSNSSSLFEDINFSELFNPHDKFINTGEKTSYDLMSYDLGIFSSVSSIYKALNIKMTNTNKKNSMKELSEKKNDENVVNFSDNKENIFTDSVIKLLLSESSNKKSEKLSNMKIRKDSDLPLNEEDLDELLKD